MKQITILVILFNLYSASIVAQNSNNNIIPTDYSIEKNWSITDKTPVFEIDVFFVHPTTYGPPTNGKYLANLDDTELNTETDIYTINRMTSVFEKNCNIFAPRYRQVNFEVLGMSQELRDEYFKTPVADIKEALSYYLKNFNNGRPFILASHSQGSDVLQLILLENPDIIDKKKLVTAYMPGWTFTDEILHRIGIQLSSQPDDLGTLSVWNTIGPNGSSPTLTKGARCVNPLSWSSDTSNYLATDNMGANILLVNKEEVEINHFTSAKINKDGGLEIPKPIDEVYESIDMGMGPECYHKYDYDFFYNNILENVRVRCNAYLENQR